MCCHATPSGFNEFVCSWVVCVHLLDDPVLDVDVGLLGEVIVHHLAPLDEDAHGPYVSSHYPRAKQESVSIMLHRPDGFCTKMYNCILNVYLSVHIGTKKKKVNIINVCHSVENQF